MKWTTTADVKTQLERYWKSGELCRAAVNQSELFPLKISFKSPTAKVMLETFGDMQDWVKLIMTFANKHHLKLEKHNFNHRNLGRQQLPAALLLESPEQAASLIGKRNSLQLFCKLYKQTATRLPELQTWLLKRPVKSIELESDWFRLVDLCLWIRTHPTPKIYLRQVNLAGIDSKFIESYRQVLAELFDLVLPAYIINDDFSGVAGFASRYGFLDKPLMLRLRPLDTKIQLLHTNGPQDVVMTAPAFGRLAQTVQSQTKRVFIVENEINYLVFPPLPNALIIFGSGYGFEALSQAKWLHGCELYYWGDMDTHGFAILDQLRKHFPHVKSLLMDRQTLIEHQYAWGYESKQEQRDLSRLTAEEAELYDDLRSNQWTDQLRLEQERIAFTAVMKAVRSL